MAESTTKTFTVTAEAASTVGGTRKRKRRTTAKGETMKIAKEQHGGTSPGTSLQVEGNRAPGGANLLLLIFKKAQVVSSQRLQLNHHLLLFRQGVSSLQGLPKQSKSF